MQETFRCPECGQEFPSQAALSDHMAKEHSTIRTDRPQDQEPELGEENPVGEAPDPAEGDEFPAGDALDDEVPEPAVPER
jgi:C2H2-type zinc finger protein